MHDEDQLELRTRMLRLIADLGGAFAKDLSEQANVVATNLIRQAFSADAAAIFYMNSSRQYHYCLAGTDFPITLPAERWKSSVSSHYAEGGYRFGPWAPPGMDPTLPLWISYRLYTSKTEIGFIFLGREKFDWSDEELSDLIEVAQSIAPIIQVRFERVREEKTRREAEKRLLKNERRLRTFLEGSRDMIYTADAADLVTSVNAAGLALLGYPDKASIIGKPFSSFIVDPADRTMLLRRVRESGYTDDYELIFKRADGSVFFCLETAYAIRNQAGHIVELQGIVKDITERIASESAMMKMNLELAESNSTLQQTQAVMVQHEKLASIGQLSAGVAHEINNPLGFLKSNNEMLHKYVQTIADAWDEAKAVAPGLLEGIEKRRDLPYIRTEIDAIFNESADGFSRIMGIVGNLKNFARIDQGEGFEPYDVNAGIQGTLVVAMNEIKFIADVKLELGAVPRVMARGSEINQVFLNILVNAAQAIESQHRQKKGTIELKTYEEPGHAVIRIRDDGPGMPESVRKRIFDPFFTTKAPGKGTGLGLSISYDIIVTKHGGSLQVDSDPQTGTTFTIALPIEGAPASQPSNCP